MGGVSVGAVGAAIVAGVISIIGMIIGKEQKVSEFRQAWINDLRQCLSDYLVCINAVCDLKRLKNSGTTIDANELVKNYKDLNKANHGIILRVNSEEDIPKELILAMEEFERLAGSKDKFTPDAVKRIERKYLSASKKLLKHEWSRVKKGEPTFYYTKRILIAVTSALILAFGLYYFADDQNENEGNAAGQRTISAPGNR